MSRIRPKISVLTSEQIEEVHTQSLKVLARTGIRIDSLLGRELFNRAIGSNSNNEHIRIPSELVESAIKSSPSAIKIFNRKGDDAFILDSKNPDRTYFGTGVTNLYYQDPVTDRIIPFTREHVKISSRLCQRLDNYDVISTPGIMQNNILYSDLYTTLEMTSNSIKPLVLLVPDSKHFIEVLDLLNHLFNDISTKPFIIPYFNPLTPLILNESTVNKVFTTIEYGLPLIFSNYGMSGATVPITAAGTLVTLNAELLAGLVLTQLIKEGSQVILGSLPAVFDQKNMISSYTSQSMLLNIACSEMMNYYGIPHCGTSGSGTGWDADILASGTLWINHMTASMGKAGLCPFVGGNFDSQVYSPETVIYSDEIIGTARQFSDGFELNEKTIALQEIGEIGPGGNFLTSDLTLSHFLEIQLQQSKIWPAYSYDRWQRENSPAARNILKKYSLDLMRELTAPDGYEDIIGRGGEFIKKLKIDNY